jgi:hypothetical protein
VLHILVPAALPSILSGLKIGWAFAWRTLIAAELVFGASSGKGGLGWYIFQNRNELYTDKVFAGLAVVILIGCWWKAGVQYPGAADRAALGHAALTCVGPDRQASGRSATILLAAFGVLGWLDGDRADRPQLLVLSSRIAQNLANLLAQVRRLLHHHPIPMAQQPPAQWPTIAHRGA